MWEPLNDAFDHEEAYGEYLKQREGRGMATEIRIKDILGYECEYISIGSSGRRCAKKARRWELEYGATLFHLCDEHGEALIALLKLYAGDHSITITGGYDDEPKSKLGELPKIREQIIDGDVGYMQNFLNIVDYLIEKERTND